MMGERLGGGGPVSLGLDQMMAVPFFIFREREGKKMKKESRSCLDLAVSFCPAKERLLFDKCCVCVIQ